MREDKDSGKVIDLHKEEALKTPQEHSQLEGAIDLDDAEPNSRSLQELLDGLGLTAKNIPIDSRGRIVVPYDKDGNKLTKRERRELQQWRDRENSAPSRWETREIAGSIAKDIAAYLMDDILACLITASTVEQVLLRKGLVTDEELRESRAEVIRALYDLKQPESEPADKSDSSSQFPETESLSLEPELKPESKLESLPSEEMQEAEYPKPN